MEAGPSNLSLGRRRGTFPREGREGALIPVLTSYGPPPSRFPATRTGLGGPRGLPLVAALLTRARPPIAFASRGPSPNLLFGTAPFAPRAASLRCSRWSPSTPTPTAVTLPRSAAPDPRQTHRNQLKEARRSVCGRGACAVGGQGKGVAGALQAL